MPSQTEIFKRHGSEVLAFLKQRIWCRQEAEDLCQDTFVCAFRDETKLADVRNMRSYLLRIANNLLINKIRRRKLVTSEGNMGEGIDLEEYANPDQLGPSTATELLEFQRQLTEQIASLKPSYRRAFEKGVLQRQPYAELAREFGWSVAKVKVTVYRARREIMDGLREYQPRSKSTLGGS